MSENDLDTRLGRIEGKVDIMLQLMTEDRKRLASVEKKVWGSIGTAVVAVGTAVAHKFGVMPVA